MNTINYRLFGTISIGYATIADVIIGNTSTQIVLSGIDRNFVPGEYVTVVDVHNAPVLFNNNELTGQIIGLLNSVVVDPANQGSGYTYAWVEIGGNGYAASARAIISPYGGHGKDAYEELFARTLMFYSNVSKDKNQGFDVNNDYRQLGIIKNSRIYNGTNSLSSISASACWVI